MILHFSHVRVLGFMSFLSLEFFFSFSYSVVEFIFSSTCLFAAGFACPAFPC